MATNKSSIGTLVQQFLIAAMNESMPQRCWVLLNDRCFTVCSKERMPNLTTIGFSQQIERLIFIWEDVADGWMKRPSNRCNQIVLVGVYLTCEDFRDRGMAVAD